MRVDITYKFVMGFIIVVGSIVLLNLLIPHTGLPDQYRELVAIAVALAVGLLLGWLFSKVFTANIRSLREAADRLSKGDLSRYVRLRKTLFQDETEDLANSLNTVVESLRELVGYIRSTSVKTADAAQTLSATSREMTASAHEVANTMDQISHGAETQTEMVERTSGLIREMAMAVDLIAASARKVEEAAGQTAVTAEEGGQVARETTKRMRQLFQSVEAGGKQIVAFGSQVQQIGHIVEVITGIAQKTNLLALNATIEAARAGEYGRGFAVVADEIRKLADSTGASAGEITRLVETIREENQRVLDTIQLSMQEVEAGHQAIDRTGASFEAIIETAGATREKANSIADLTAKQTAGAQKMVQAIEEISRVISDNAASVEEVSAASEEQSASMEEMARQAQELSRLAEELLGMVSRFHLGSDRE
ncbi:MAG: methyl-accepting chemotaxis protein [Geothermobacteraceae bacterium]